jgi:hypothetical protein
MAKESRVVSHYQERNTIETWETTRLELTAELAWNLLVRWGMVSAKEDGEDTAGRQKLVLTPPADTVTRAFDIAEQFMSECQKRNYIHTSPSLLSMKETSDV